MIDFWNFNCTLKNTDNLRWSLVPTRNRFGMIHMNFSDKKKAQLSVLQIEYPLGGSSKKVVMFTSC